MNGNGYQIAVDTIDSKINKNESFTYDSVCREIVSNGGILRVSIGVTIGMYLNNLVKLNILDLRSPEGFFESKDK